jgi:signal peptidase I
MPKKKSKEFYYPEKQGKRRRLLRICIMVLAFLFLYILLTTLVFTNRVVETDTMRNGIQVGDRLIFTSNTPASILPVLNRFSQPERGDVVLVQYPLPLKEGGAAETFKNILAPLVLFFTAQRLDISSGGNSVYIKRVIGIPGDTVSMQGSVFRVQSEGSPYLLTEFEMAGKNYDPLIPNLPAAWDGSLPLSGTMDSIKLGPGEYFVASDDRSNTNDSRTWGVVRLENFLGQALFRYWPLNRLGIP